ncbi:hypothetical protein BDV95DRAFT_47464 [Massariosphaeria phaeospora]|uniref:BZIP domain-containing protein n=1 Tax=Massariosphaeria phaeospora TaxID=100035 RepID=A0A7C8MA15_9PLEO|nr:hypothetical protein BDV95DRAFT_47464 [Massariosphaeria phaeospora]
MNETKASKAQNLARIRDNQRRSRARRKQYLHELEAKLRSCEQMGIEASSEIQSAARKVLEENRKLRALLRERGVLDTEIAAVVGGPNDKPYEHVSAAPALNTMLDRRIICNRPSPSNAQATSAPLAPHTPAVPPITIPAQRAAALSSNDSPSPSSIVSASSMGTPPGYHSTPFYTGAMNTPEIKSEDIPPYNFPYEQPLNSSWGYSSEPAYVPDAVAYYNNSSCVDAANIIRTMRSDVGPEMETDFACRAPPQECYVDNTTVFHMMDRYSNTRA